MSTDPHGDTPAAGAGVPLDRLLQTPEEVAEFLDGLTFTDDPIAPEQVPPVLGEDEDVLVPRSFKLPMRLDDHLSRLAELRRISKSELVRRYLETAVAADLAVEHGAGPDHDVLIPLADALRALAALRHLPRTA